MSPYYIVSILFFLFIFSVYLSSFNKKYAWIFPFFHFISGFLLASLLSIYTKNQTRIIILVFIMSLIWEFYEYLVDKLSFCRKIFSKYFNIKETSISLKDTITDLILDILGATLFILVFL